MIVKEKINLIGGGFQHADSSSGYSIPKYVEWVKGEDSAPISVFIDDALLSEVPKKNKKNYAWLLESSAIIPHVLSWVNRNIDYLEEHFEYIFTHDVRLLGLSPKFKKVITNAVPWVEDFGIHKKSKHISMIASNKRMCYGHHYRHEVLQKYPMVDHFGWGYGRLDRKENALNEYMFSIAMENDNYDDIFTEKITDCFVTGTVPIFWGTPTIGERFDSDGIITLDDDFDINKLTEELYYSKMEAIKNNFDIAMGLPIAEDYIYEKYIK